MLIHVQLGLVNGRSEGQFVLADGLGNGLAQDLLVLVNYLQKIPFGLVKSLGPGLTKILA